MKTNIYILKHTLSTIEKQRLSIAYQNGCERSNLSFFDLNKESFEQEHYIPTHTISTIEKYIENENENIRD